MCSVCLVALDAAVKGREATKVTTSALQQLSGFDVYGLDDLVLLLLFLLLELRLFFPSFCFKQSPQSLTPPFALKSIKIMPPSPLHHNILLLYRT